MFAKKTNKTGPNLLLDDQADKKRREYNECVSQIKQEMGQIGHLALRQEAVRRMTEKKLAEERATASKQRKLRKKKKSFNSVVRLFRKDTGVSHDEGGDDFSDDGSVGSKSILSSGMESLSSMFFSTDDDVSHGTSHSLVTAHSFVTAPADLNSHLRGLSSKFPGGNPPVQRRGSMFFRDAGSGHSQRRSSLFRDGGNVGSQRRGSIFRDGSVMSSRSSVSSVVSGDHFIRRRSSVIGENPFSSNDTFTSSVRQDIELSDSDSGSVISVSSEYDDEDDIRRFRRAFSMRRSTGSATAEEFISEMSRPRHPTSKRRSSVSATDEVESAADEFTFNSDDREKRSADKRRSSRSIADDGLSLDIEKRRTKNVSCNIRPSISAADEAVVNEDKGLFRRNHNRRRSSAGTADECPSSIDDEDHFQNVLLAQRAVLEKRYSSGRSHEGCETISKGFKINPRLGMRTGESIADDFSDDNKGNYNIFFQKPTRKDRVSDIGDVSEDPKRNERVETIDSIPFSDDEEVDSKIDDDHNDSYREGSLICGWRRNSSISYTTSDDEESEDEELICSWRRST